MTEAEMKQWIDEQPYVELLRKWRFSTTGDPFFQGEMGDYYKGVMFRKRDALPRSEQVAASKAIGWI